ncbi:N-acetylmuramoyl-L-alanine amidase [Companilactobacillus allii]|uniref:N-acetylmuramoyl-L-alanine amidase domain-containing protein n=1 Tax=Companilactobacillus allii TaxID=1847728 RepID=A0A1P8Q2K9_9LACO|nr:SLAP domain-containing protein [Companilactobacillus allii]APX72100.1 hypothetical protein BTM29_05765 [Companilactobacillus allii]USQ69192.1 N-acetylmuramoyl-L-alanine amidase [Companilactobacillus allii]
MFNPNVIKMNHVLSGDQGDARVAQKKYIIVHESGNDKDTKYADMLSNEVTFMHNNYSSAYTTHFVGYMDTSNEAQIYQIGTPGYVSWGALSANPYAPVQIEFARVYQNDRAKFKQAYHLYIEAIRYYAGLYEIPLKLDEAGNGVKSHQWITNNYGGDHQDPYAYFASMGISKSQFKHDVENGIDEVVQDTKVNRTTITIQNGPKSGIAGWTLEGKIIPGSNSKLVNGSSWLSNGLKKINGLPMYKIANDEYIPKKYTDQAGIVTINGVGGISSVTSTGEKNIGSESKFQDLTQWKTTDKLYQIAGRYYFKVATDEYIDAFYTIGGGNK